MIIVKRRPYEINFSGNSIVYELFDQAAVANPEVTFEVRIVLVRSDSTVEVPLAIVPLTPYQGTAKIDLREILNSELTFDLPDPDDLLPIKGTGKQSGKFYIEFRSVTPSNTDPSWSSTEAEFIRYVIKGGIAPFSWNNNSFFTSYFPIAKPFFTWQKNGRLASLHEPIWLGWLNTDYTSSSVPKVRVVAIVTYTDGSTANKALNVLPLTPFYFYFIPAGAAQLGLDALQANKTIWYWQVRMEDITVSSSPVTISETFKFELDQRNDYNGVTLHYRGSLGGIDGVRVRGVIETSVNLEGNDAEHAADIDWSFQTALSRMDKSLPHREVASFKGDIGHLDKEEQDRLRDAFINREVYQINGDRWWPVKLTTKQYKLRSTADMRFTLPIDWIIADAGSFYYTPGNASLGPGFVTNNICPSTVVITSHSITFSGGLAELQFNYSVIGSFVRLQYRIPGYQDSWKDFNSGTTGSLEHTVPKGVKGIVQMRTICVGNAAGAIETFGFDATNVVLVNNSNVYNLTPYPFTAIIRYELPVQTLFYGVVLPDQYRDFHTPDGLAKEISVRLLLHKPTKAKLTSNGQVYNAVISGSTATFTNVQILNGCIITLDDN